MAKIFLVALVAFICLTKIEAYTYEESESNMLDDMQEDFNVEAEQEETDMLETDEKEEFLRELENGLVEAFVEGFEAGLKDENMEEARNFEDEEEANLKELEQDESERQIIAQFDVTPKEEEARQIEQMLQKGRSTKPLRLSHLIVRPVLTKRCQGRGNHTTRFHCAKYLECGGKLFHGSIRTCESGLLFDAKVKTCEKSSTVDCKLL